jgi:glyoxylase-like metal-dependent hydrolase (beta-lactamase superfamily II)
MKIEKFTFGPFQENTFVLHDETKECVIVDPGCYGASEQIKLSSFISKNNLTPVLLLNTHCHVDHVAGNKYIFDTYGLKPLIHLLDLPVLNMQEQVSEMYNLPFEKSPEPDKFIDEGDKILFGNSELEVFFTPGHCPGHVTFFHKKTNSAISGDVLFYNSIGRTDLPGGDHDVLILSIKTKLFPLGDSVRIYSGHGPETTIGHEKQTNPYLS